MLRDTAADIGDDLQAAAAPIIDKVVSTAALFILAVIMVPVGLAIVVVSLLLVSLIYAAIGTPSEPVGIVIALSWLVGVVGALFLAFRFLYRRVPRRLRSGWARSIESPEPGAPSAVTPLAMPQAPTLAELDARFAIGSPEPTGTTTPRQP